MTGADRTAGQATPAKKPPLAEEHYLGRVFDLDDPAEYQWEAGPGDGSKGCGCSIGPIMLFLFLPFGLLDTGLGLLFILPYPRFTFWFIFSVTIVSLVWLAVRAWSSLRSPRDLRTPIFVMYVLFWCVLYAMASEYSFLRFGFGGPTADPMQWLRFALDRLLRVATFDFAEVFGWTFSRIVPQTWYARAATAVLNVVIAGSIVAAVAREYRLRHRAEVFYGTYADALEHCEELMAVGADDLVVRRTARLQPVGGAIALTPYQLKYETGKKETSLPRRKPRVKQWRSLASRLSADGPVVLYRLFLFTAIPLLFWVIEALWSPVPITLPVVRRAATNPFAAGVHAAALVLVVAAVRHIAEGVRRHRASRALAGARALIEEGNADAAIAHTFAAQRILAGTALGRRSESTEPLLVRALAEAARGRAAEARALYGEVIALHEQKFGTLHRLYGAALSGFLEHETDPAKRQETIEKGIEISRACDDAGTERWFLRQRYSDLKGADRTRDRVETLTRYVRVTEQTHGLRSIRTAEAHVRLAHALLLAADFRAAYLTAAHAMAFLESNGSAPKDLLLAGARELGAALFFAGRYADAERRFRRAAEEAEPDGRRWLPYLRAGAAEALLKDGRPEEALPLVATLDAEADGTSSEAALWRLTKADVLCANGQVADAERTCNAAWELIVTLTDLRQELESAAYACESRIHHARGHLGAARTAQMRAIRRASPFEVELPFWHQHLAEIALALGDHHEAALHADRAMEMIRAWWGEEHPVIDACRAIRASADARLPHETPWIER